MKTKILIIEDDRDLNNLLRFTLETSLPAEVTSLFRGEQALETCRSLLPDLIVLDVMLPDIYGTEILKQIRAEAGLTKTPVVLLTARGREEDRVAGFEAGADDYVTKPFSPRELLLRVQALLRRAQPQGEPPLAPAQPATVSTATGSAPPQTTSREEPANGFTVAGPIRINKEKYKVWVGDKPVALTMTEFQLLLHLAERVGRLQSREVLLQKVWGYEGNINTRTVDTHVKRLRQKLGEHGNLIETVHGFGYQLNIPEK